MGGGNIPFYVILIMSMITHLPHSIGVLSVTWKLARNADSQPLPQVNWIRPSSLARSLGNMSTYHRLRTSVLDTIGLCLLNACILHPSTIRGGTVPLSFMSLSSVLAHSKHLICICGIHKKESCIILILAEHRLRTFCDDGSVLYVLCSMVATSHM